MAKRSATPALYEKMRTRPDARPTPAASRYVEPSPRAVAAEEPRTNWLGPGRILRMPVGYALLAAAAALTLVIATYVIAFQRGRTVGKADIKSQMISDLTGSGEQRVPNDPLYELNSTPAGGKSSTALPPGSNRKTSPTASNYQGRPTAAWGQVVADVKCDPRKQGLNYFVVIETQEAGARKVADFCRSNGLESYVVPGNNDRLRRAIILPG